MTATPTAPLDRRPPSRLPAALGGLLALCLLALGALLLVLLLAACVADDASPHACPRSYFALVILGCVALAGSFLALRTGRRGRLGASVAVFAGFAGVLWALAFVLARAGDALP
jgi:hypothetical protein